MVAVTAGNMSQTVSTTGTLAPADTQNLNFSTSGQVTAVNVKAGQQVTKGTVLATIDSAALQSQVTSAQASVDSATAKLSNDQTPGASAAQVQAGPAPARAIVAQPQAKAGRPSRALSRLLPSPHYSLCRSRHCFLKQKEEVW